MNVREPLFRRLALIGVGLIGSSVARIARERGDLAAEVVVNRADFGMAWNQMGMASMNNTITIHAVFTRK